MMKGRYSPKDLGYEFTDKELQEILDKYHINVFINDNTQKWLAFGIDYGVNNNLSEIAAISFGGVLSFLITSKRLSNIQTDVFVYEKEIEDEAMDFLKSLKDEEEITQIKNVIVFLFDLYKEVENNN